MAAGTTAHVEYLRSIGIIRLFMQMLRHTNLEVKEQAVWGLANVGAEGHSFRASIVQEGGLRSLVVTAWSLLLVPGSTRTHARLLGTHFPRERLHMLRLLSWALETCALSFTPKVSPEDARNAIKVATFMFSVSDRKRCFAKFF